MWLNEINQQVTNQPIGLTLVPVDVQNVNYPIARGVIIHMYVIIYCFVTKQQFSIFDIIEKKKVMRKI